MGGLATRAAAGLKLRDLRPTLATDVERCPDQRLANAFSADRLVDHDLVEPRLDPERSRVDDHGGRTDYGVAFFRDKYRHRRVGDQTPETLHVGNGQLGIELRQQPRERGVQVGGWLRNHLDLHALSWSTIVQAEPMRSTRWKPRLS